MNKNLNWFSIIEIIISTVILTMWVFWVYKLIGNNMSYISNNENLLQQNLLYAPMRECIKSIGYDTLSGSYNSWDSFSINFWDNQMWCFTGSYDANYDFTWVVVDNQEYFLYGKINSKSATRIKLELNIYTTLNKELFQSGAPNEENKYLILKKP